MAAQTPPAWASLPYQQMQVQRIAPVIAYHRHRPTNRVPEHVTRGLFTLGLGLAGIFGMVLYEMGHGKIAFSFSLAAGVVGSFLAAAEVMTYSMYSDEEE